MTDKPKTSAKKPAPAKGGKKAAEPTSAEKMREALARVKAAKGGSPGGGPAQDGKRANASALKGAQVKAASMNRRTQSKGG